MFRTQCVLCDKASLSSIFTLEKYPITPSSSSLGPETNELKIVSLRAAPLSTSLSASYPAPTGHLFGFDILRLLLANRAHTFASNSLMLFRWVF